MDRLKEIKAFVSGGITSVGGEMRDISQMEKGC